MTNLSLETNFLGVKFSNPLILPSGIIQEIPAHKKAEEAGVGGITTKSLTVEPREGNPLPRVIKYEHGYLNSVGLRNPGIDKGVKILKEFQQKTRVPVIMSIAGFTVDEYVILGEKILAAAPEFVELNISCPNTVDELGEPISMGVGTTRKAVAIVREIVGRKVKIIAKLSPNVQDIGRVAMAAQEGGADAISAINTVGPGMVIDIEKRQPVLGNKEGGVSGPGIKPIAIRCIYDIYEAVDIPMVGIGGVEKWEDVVEMMMAGAILVGVGSAVYLRGYKVFEEIKQGLLNYMEENNLTSLSQIVGVAH